MACDAVATIPMLGCCGPVDTTKDFINRAFVSIDGFDVRNIPEFADPVYAWNFGMGRLTPIDLDRPFETGQTHQYSRVIQGEWNVQNPDWQTFQGPTWTGPGTQEVTLNASVVFNSGQGKYGFQAEKIRIRFTRRCVHSIYDTFPPNNALVSFTIYEAGQIGEFAPLANGPNAHGPWQTLWPCRRGTAGQPAHVVAACGNPFA